MARYAYEKLSPQDNAFLQWEGPGLPMHVSALQIFDAGPLAVEGGGIDFDAVRDHIASKLHLLPSYRQKLMWIPGEDAAVWVDDPHFSVDYHVRHSALPHPGTHDQLLRLASRLMEQPLDRSRPLWETWVVEGLEGDRFALIGKTHHCMLDGGAGAELMTNLLSREPTKTIADAPAFRPRPLPSARELRRDVLLERMATPLRLLGAAVDFARDPGDATRELRERASAMSDLVGWYVKPASETPINGPVGPHRLFGTLETPLERLLEVRRELRCSVNDVVLAIVAGALREFLAARRVRTGDLDFRVSTPVDIRRPEEAGSFGNRVSSWIVPLPLGEADPLARLEAIRKETRARKGRKEADAVELLTQWTDWLPLDVQQASARATNCIVTNVRGPGFPLYLLGARQLSLFPQPPLLANQGLAIGVVSYAGMLCWGLNADADRIPDLADLVAGLERSLDALSQAVGVAPRDGPAVRAVPRPAAVRREPVPTPTLVWPDASVAPQTASELREAILAQHAVLSELLDAVETAAARVQGGDGSVLELLRERARELHDRMSEHLEFEDRCLVPTVRAVEAWGPERARQIDEEHVDQRELLAFVLGRLEDRGSPVQLLAEQLRSFVGAVRDDMHYEEEAVLSDELLRDDVVAVDAVTG
jgi:WS/DGAT/MGAT family acyltransferase